MTRMSAGICFAAVVAASAVCARADEQDPKAEIQAIYDHIAKAVEKKDIDGVGKYSLPDATVKYADGTGLTLKEWKERARKGWANIKEAKSRIVVEEAKVDGDACAATYTEAHDLLLADPRDGKEHKVSYRSKWRATLKKTADGWRLSRSIEVERRVTRDGELIDLLPRDKPRP